MEDHVLFHNREGDVTNPQITFQVNCAEETGVAYLLVKGPASSIGVHNRDSEGGLEDDGTTLAKTHSHSITTATCSYHSRRMRGDDENTTDAPVVEDNITVAPTTGPPKTVDPAHATKVKSTDFVGKESLHYTENGKLVELKYGCHNQTNLLVAEKYTSNAYYWGRFNCKPKDQEDNRKTTLELFNANYEGHWTLYIEGYTKNISGTITYHNVDGHLSSEQYPLMLFYGIWGLGYLVMGLGWMIAMALHHEDLLRLQFALCVVIFVGMLEFAFAFGDYDYWNRFGSRGTGLFGIASLFHAAKDTVARVLVLVVSMGYGVVKPRLNRSTTTQIGGAAVIYLIFVTIYNINHIVPVPTETSMSMDDQDTRRAESKYALIAIIPMSVMDAICLWWVFYALHHTMKILVLRQNHVKLELYQRFRLLLAFFAVAAIVYFIWTMANDYDVKHNHAWKNIWFEEAFKHVLFTVVLIGIMVLWRPSMNNSRYAYATLEMDLLDEDENEKEESVVPNFGSETLKGRTKSARGMKVEQKFDVEDELAWVEEHIPSNVMSNDNTIGSFALDSDEEIMETRLMVSKME